MSVAQRVKSGFHRQAFFLAAIPLVVGTILNVPAAVEQANMAKATAKHKAKLVCAQTALLNDWNWVDVSSEDTAKPASPSGIEKSEPVERIFDDLPYDLKAMGCSHVPLTATLNEILAANPRKAFSYAASLLPPLGYYLSIALAVSLGVYLGFADPGPRKRPRT
jgi:hypothetical protein